MGKRLHMRIERQAYDDSWRVAAERVSWCPPDAPYMRTVRFKQSFHTSVAAEQFMIDPE